MRAPSSIHLSSDCAVSPAEANALWADYTRTRSVALRNKLAEVYLPLVRNIASKLVVKLPEEVQLDDMIQVGSIALLKAIERFDIARGFKFPTLAGRIVLGGMLDELRRLDVVTRLVRNRTKIVAEAVAVFEAQHGKPPTRDELRERINVSTEQFDRIISARVVETSLLSKVVAEDEETGRSVSAADLLPDQNGHKQTAEIEVRDLIRCVLRDFGVTDALFLKCYYLEGATLVTLSKWIGGGITECGMSVRRRELIEKLRGRYRSDMLRAMAGAGRAA